MKRYTPEELQAVLADHKRWLKSEYGDEGSRANLSGAYLYGADLSGADLSRADLSDATLSGATLSGANLYGAFNISSQWIPAGWELVNNFLQRKKGPKNE